MIKDNTLDYDKYGHCTLCHKNMYIQQIIDEVPTWRLTSDYTEKEVLLSNGTKMRVAMCKDCKAKTTDSDNKKIMNCVIRGWDIACDELVKDKNKPHWTKEKKKEYINKYSKLEIVTSSEGIDKDVLESKLKKFKKDK